MDKLIDNNTNNTKEHKIFTLKIQDTPLQDQDLKQSSLKKFAYTTTPTTYYYQNNQTNINESLFNFTGNSFFDAFYAAYCFHGDVMISANDIWLAVSHKFSKVINQNPEKYRDLFVFHEGKKEITIFLDGTKPEWQDFPCRENRWDIAMEMFNNEIGKYTKDDIALLMKNDFSSTTKVEQAASNICLMAQMKSYFKYTMQMFGCGIQNAHFIGGIEDFEYLVVKIYNLMYKYPLNEQFKSFLENVLKIVNIFVDQMKNPSKVDITFWDSIFDEIQVNKTGISGKLIGKQPAFKGWITNFFGVSEIKKEDVPSFSSSAPVLAIDNIKQKSYNLVFETDMKGIEEVKPNVFKPITNVIVKKQTENTTK